MIYGYNVYFLDEYPRYPLFCGTWEDVINLVGDPDRDDIVIRSRLHPEDSDILEGDL